MHACERPRIGMTMKDNDHVLQWKHSLPTTEELTPLSKSLLSPALQSVFSIKPEPPKSALDVSRESRASFLELRSQSQRLGVPSFDSFPLFKERKDSGSYRHPVECRSDGEGERRGKCLSDFAVEGRGDVRVDLRRERREAEEPEVGLGLGIGSGCSGGSSDRGGSGVAEKQGHGGQAMGGLFRGGGEAMGYNPSEGRAEQSSAGVAFVMNGLAYGGSERRAEGSSYSGRGDEKGGGNSKNARKVADSELEDTDSGGGPVNSNEEANARTLKRPRLVWTPQLHKRFVDAVGHLGIKNAVPKTIMQLMNVEGLTRENVASHLQKYRLYLKRLQGLSSDGPAAAAEQLFASTAVAPSVGLQYMASQREDVGPQAFPSGGVAMAFQGLGGRGGVGPAQLSAYEAMSYGSMSRGFMERPPMKDRTEHMSESENYNQQSHHSVQQQSLGQNQARSPPKRLLSLFPTASE